VSSVVLQLGDFSNTLDVSGSSPGNVDALSRLIVGDLATHKGWLGGGGLRAFLAVPLVFAISYLLVALAFAVESNRRLALQLSIWLIGSVGLLAIPRWNHILPGAALYRGSPSFLVRYSAEISFAGVLLTVVFGLLGVLLSKRRRKQKPSA
jgi:hypothetical protein